MRVECPECKGMGEHEWGPICEASCEWCGGCYRYDKCDLCLGAQEIELDGLKAEIAECLDVVPEWMIVCSEDDLLSAIVSVLPEVRDEVVSRSLRKC